ncbi:MAG: Alpha/beta hydrolase family protein [Candidatus Eremiobacteraeota bacterium]|nr:Alpha/beta hydrolase family protein [Candidatus Eremiobacteraeota bacterium]
MRSLAAPLAALILVAAAPASPGAPAATSAPAGGSPAAPASVQAVLTSGYKPAPAQACYRPKYDGTAGVTLLFGGAETRPTNSVLVAPANPKSAPGVLWVHWLGEPATTNHTEFMSDAQELAKHGVVSLLVDMPWSQKEWFTSLRTPETDYADTIAQVMTLRRALDCLTAVAGVDSTRIAYVGHDFGAMDGALLLGIDARPQYAVLMAPTLSYWEWYLLGKQPADPAAYVARMSAFDLPGWLAQGKQKATLLQFGQNDEYVSQATGIALRNAVPNRDRTFKAYKLDHALDDVTVHDDRRAWLIAHLGI